MSVQKFEDLIAWQKARVLAADVYRAVGHGAVARDFGLRDQMQRAAVSIMANIAEGFERRSPADFARFLTIAKASCAELKSHCFLAMDVGYINADLFRKLHDQAEEVNRIIGGLKASLNIPTR